MIFHLSLRTSGSEYLSCWEMIRVTRWNRELCPVHLTSEENPGKPQYGGRLMNAVRPVIAQMGESLTSKCRRLDSTVTQGGRRKEKINLWNEGEIYMSEGQEWGRYDNSYLWLWCVFDLVLKVAAMQYFLLIRVLSI